MPESLLIPPLPEAVARQHNDVFAATAGEVLTTAPFAPDAPQQLNGVGASLVAQCQQGNPLTTGQLTLLGEQLGRLHTLAIPPSFAELSDEPFRMALRQAWGVFRLEGSLPALESASQERLRQRFLDQHAMALQVVAYELEARLHRDALPPVVRGVAHGGLSLTALGVSGQGRIVVAPAVTACALPPWWDMGCVLAWLPLLAHVSYSAVHYEPVLLKAYLAVAPVESPYEFVRQALPVAGLTLASLLLNDRLSWIKDIYLKEIFLKQALGWVNSPSQVDWLVQLPH